ncbi:MAG: phospho-sugar mutase, partial [Tidjanibacter sp.]|nr:phospho-sugar mutase [Tidjanibacter sp.]
MEINSIALQKAQNWLEGSFDNETKQKVKYLMENDIKEFNESFYRDLEFGTGGLRGILGVGTNRMNIYTVGMATQGLANYLKICFPDEEIKVVISHDCRNFSREFAEKTADIFASNG